MANILFFCNYQVAQPACGGIVRVSGILAELFTKHGHNCYLCYFFDNPGEPCPYFLDRLVLEPHNEEEKLSRFILDNKIDILLLQVPLNNTNWYLLPMLRKVSDNTNHCTLIHCIHNVPFAECKGFDWSYIRYMMREKEPFMSKCKKILWGLICHYFPKAAILKTRVRYERICKFCDKTILLSDRYIPYFVDNVRCDKNTVLGIKNPLTYTSRLSKDEIDSKENTVVVVGRINESWKRLSKAIRIWSLIENKYKVDDWSLIFVGDGGDMDYFQNMTAKKGLRHVTFAGRQDPVEYYRKASIIMSTSAIEGLPMVLLEAKQMGCVPIVFNSYDTVYDLITDSYNGYIVDYNDYKGYAAKLHYLMTHDDVRKEMIENCLNSNADFLPDNIYKEWEKVLQ